MLTPHDLHTSLINYSTEEKIDLWYFHESWSRRDRFLQIPLWECNFCSRPTSGVKLSNGCCTCHRIPLVCAACAVTYIFRGHRDEIKCKECFITGLYNLARRPMNFQSSIVEKTNRLEAEVRDFMAMYLNTTDKFALLGFIASSLVPRDEIFSVLTGRTGGSKLERIIGEQDCSWDARRRETAARGECRDCSYREMARVGRLPDANPPKFGKVERMVFGIMEGDALEKPRGAKAKMLNALVDVEKQALAKQMKKQERNAWRKGRR